MALKDHAPWLPFLGYKNSDIHAIKNLYLGEASPEQQTRAIEFIVKSLCKTYDLSYRSDSERDTAFAEGMRHVGLQIVKFANYDPVNMRNENDRSGNR